MNFRFAQPADATLLANLYRLYLREQWNEGDPVVPNGRSVRALTDLTYSYLKGSGFGFVVLAEEGAEVVGFALCGEHPGRPMFDTTLGRLLQVWAVWVRPSHRKANVALSMLSFGRPRAVEMGFITAAMGVRAENDKGRALTLSFGARPSETLYLFPLRGKE